MFFDDIKKNIIKKKFFFALVCIFLLGAFFRFNNLNWDKNFPSHPDEVGNISFPASQISVQDPNPHRFVYGGLTIYFYRLIGETIVATTGDRSWVTDWGKINLIGRNISALVSSLSIILIFILAEKTFHDKKIAILAAFFGAFTVSLIQMAHFATTESLLIFWLLLIYLLSFELFKKNNIKIYHFLGVISGLALATKITALSFLVIPIATHLFISFQEAIVFLSARFSGKINSVSRFFSVFFEFIIAVFRNRIGGSDSIFWKKQGYLFVFLFLTFIFFFLSAPFSFLDFNHFKLATDNELAIAKGDISVFYTFQFINTRPYLFYIDNLLWLQGPLLEIFSFIGVIYALALMVIKRKIKYFLLLAWPLLYFYIIGAWHTKFVRYFSLILPFLAIWAAKFMIDMEKKWKTIGQVFIILTAVSTFLYSISFFAVYKKENTRSVASQWMYKNIPAGATILTEQYEYPGLPVFLPGEKFGQFKIQRLSMYDQDNAQKINYYAEYLSSGDYLVLGSKRMYGTLMNLSEKYPITSQYYKMLLAGNLGYELINETVSYPEIFGIQINDDSAEETFQVFDHPKILIYRNTKKFSVADYKKLLIVK